MITARPAPDPIPVVRPAIRRPVPGTVGVTPLTIAIQGFPKKLGSIHLTRLYPVGKASPRLEPGARFGATCTANDRQIARVVVTLRQISETGPTVNGPPMHNTRHFPAYDGRRRILNDEANEGFARPYKAIVIIWPYVEGNCEWFLQYDVWGTVSGILPGDQVPQLKQVAERISDDLEQQGIEHLFIFSNQVELINGWEWTRRLSSNYTEAEQYANLLRQTEKIMKLVEQTPVEVWVEGLNEFHIKGGVLVHNHELAVDWIRRINHPQLRLAFDCYHQQRGSGNLIWGLEQYHGLYPTVHIGDVPTRQEPGTGEINFPNIQAKLRELGFDGYVGLEFRPSTTEAKALARTKEIFPLDSSPRPD